MQKLSVYEVMILQEYFAKKSEPSDADKRRAQNLDEHLGIIADGIVYEKMPISEIFRRLTGEEMPSNK